MQRLVNELYKIIFNESEFKCFLYSMDLHFTHIAKLLLLAIVVICILTDLQRLLRVILVFKFPLSQEIYITHLPSIIIVI